MTKTIQCIGIVTPRILEQAEKDLHGALVQAIRQCQVLEIRYDLFAEAETWNSLCNRCMHIHPQAEILGTIRLQSDGGSFDSTQTHQRIKLWNSILTEKYRPQWIDVEWDVLSPWDSWLQEQIQQGLRVLASAHDFNGIPAKAELKQAITQVSQHGIHGFKVAAMSRQWGDAQVLYELAKDHAARFQWFAAFAMGETGQVSRLYSLRQGANLVYVSLGDAVAPGQIGIQQMQRCLKAIAALQSESEALNLLTRTKEI